jgi:hypothetical protein
VHTDRTIPNNKPDIIIHDNKKGTHLLIDVAISGDRNVKKEEAQKIQEYRDLTRHTMNVECKNKYDTNTNRGNCNHLKIIQKISEQHTGKI